MVFRANNLSLLKGKTAEPATDGAGPAAQGKEAEIDLNGPKPCHLAARQMCVAAIRSLSGIRRCHSAGWSRRVRRGTNCVSPGFGGDRISSGWLPDT